MVVDFLSFFFFFQAEDGIRDLTVTGVQTCALPISQASNRPQVLRCGTGVPVEPEVNTQAASCAVSIAGTGAGFAVSAAPPPGNGTRGRSMSQSTALGRQTTYGAEAGSMRVASGE